MKTINHYTFVNNTEILGNFHCEQGILKVEDFITYNEKDYVIKSLLQTNKTSNNDIEDVYFVATLEKLNILDNEEKIGILQIKIITDANIETLQNNVNKFLFENRFKIKVKKISYSSTYYIAIEYYNMNEKEIEMEIAKEKSYMKNGNTVTIKIDDISYKNIVEYTR